MTLRRLLLCLGALLIWMAAAAARAQPATDPVPTGKTVRVAVHVNPPFVIKADTISGYSGFAVELWETLAAKLDLKSEYRLYHHVPEMLQALMAGEVDIIVTNLTITRDRMRHIDFTQPWFDSGLRIMIHANRQTGAHELLATLTEARHLWAYLWVLLAVLVATTVLTLIDRHVDTDFPREWHKGLANSLYHVIAVATSGRTSHKEIWGWVGRLLASVWMLVGVGVVAYVTSSVTSIMTVNSLRAQIHTVADLSGKLVGTLRGTASEVFVAEMGLNTQPFDSIAEAADALAERRIEAVIADAPILEYFDKTHPKLPITEVGPLFHPEKYGFGVAIGSSLRHPLSQEIVALHESGLLPRLRRKYFGDVP